MAANSATAALQKNQQMRQQQQQQNPQLDTHLPSPSQAQPGGGGQALRAPAVFRIPVAPFPFPPSSLPQTPIKQLGSLSLRDGNDAAVPTPGQRVVRRSVLEPTMVTTTMADEQRGGGVIGMGYASSSTAGAFAGSGLLEGGAPLVKRGTSNRNTSLPSASAGLATHRSPLTPTTTVSVTTSNNIPPPPFGSGIPGQPGSGVPTSAPSGTGNEYLSHGFTQPPPVKRHHLKNWTEAEPNRLVARSKVRPAKGGDKASKDEARAQPSSTIPTTTSTKSGTYPGLGRRSSPALLNVPTSTSDSKEQARHPSVSSCASGAEADTEQERDTSLEESDGAVELVARGAIFVPAKALKVTPGGMMAGQEKNEVKRKQSPVPAIRKRDGENPQQDPARGRIPPNTTVDKRSVSPVAHVGNPSKLVNSAVPEVPQSVQGYDGGNVGVLGGGVKLGGGGGAIPGSTSSPPVMGKPDHTSRSVSAQSAGRTAAKMRSTSGSSALGGMTGSESETTIGSGAEGGKGIPGGNKKRRGRPQQSRSPNIPHSHSHDPIPPTHNMHHHQWSPVIPTHMHHPPTSGGMPGMLGCGIAGQPGSIGFTPGSTLAHGGAGWQGYGGAVPSWAPRPQGGLGIPVHSPIGPLAHSPPYAFASSSATKHAATSTTRPIMGPAVPSLPSGHSDNSSQAQYWTS
ncbi:hypothetical protein QFC21_000939 [Naganishia friedmannii]|uniref:Uncharacterized protein n=1 Tax=Naganishia friedmannii TaxID=89922 RepID=A0ACC2W6W2_9TREE|nr:hypothetical protein QFC21_000939 [Naganishia friedmannii]